MGIGRGFIGIGIGSIGACDIEQPIDLYRGDTLRVKIDIVWNNIDLSKRYTLHIEAPDRDEPHNRIFSRDFDLQFTSASGSKTVTVDIENIQGTSPSGSRWIRAWIKINGAGYYGKVVCENVINWHNTSRPSVSITSIHDFQVNPS